MEDSIKELIALADDLLSMWYGAAEDVAYEGCCGDVSECLEALNETYEYYNQHLENLKSKLKESL